MDTDRFVLEEYLRREMSRAAQGQLITAIRSELFKQQLDFVDDPSRNKAALCTRRAGKTAMWVRYCAIIALLVPRGIIRVWGITRLRAKQLLWDEFKLLFARHKIVYVSNETELTLRFPNGAEIRLLGADKDKEVQKKRGDKTVMEVILEAQTFGPYLRKLVEEVAEPCLFDMRGTFCMEGTPGPVCAGYWWDVSGGDACAGRWTSPGNWYGPNLIGSGWSLHRWSVLDNPFLPHARDELALLKTKRRWADDNPTYIREWLGRWVNDLSALYYRYDPLKNSFTLEQVQPWGPGWEHTLGWDLGFKDDMALVVWGWHPRYNTLFEAFSWKEPGKLAADVVEQIRQLETGGVTGRSEDRFNIVARVADTGGGGRMYVEEVMFRYKIDFEPAKKTEKYEHVRLFNDDLTGGFVQLRAGSVYSQEMATLPRDPDWPDPDKPESPPAEDPRFPNHCCDSGLYSWRRAWHYLHSEEPAKPMPNTPGWFVTETARMERKVIERAEKEKQTWMYGSEEAEWEEL